MQPPKLAANLLTAEISTEYLAPPKGHTPLTLILKFSGCGFFKPYPGIGHFDFFKKQPIDGEIEIYYNH